MLGNMKYLPFLKLHTYLKSWAGSVKVWSSVCSDLKFTDLQKSLPPSLPVRLNLVTHVFSCLSTGTLNNHVWWSSSCLRPVFVASDWCTHHFEFNRDLHDIFMEAWASGPEMLSGDLSLHCSSVKPHMPYSNGVNTCHKGPFRSLTELPKRTACHDHPIYPNHFQKHLTAVDSTHFVSPNWFLRIMKLDAKPTVNDPLPKSC